MASDSKHEIAVSAKPQSEIPEPPPPSQMFGPLAEAERLFDKFILRNWMRPVGWNWPMWGGLGEAGENLRMPQLDVINRDKDVLVRVEVPGVEKKDIDVSIVDNTLSIKGCVSREKKEESKDYFRCEIAQGNFSRSLSLPAGIDPAKIAASLKDGVLEVVLPKEEGAQRRPIEVK